MPAINVFKYNLRHLMLFVRERMGMHSERAYCATFPDGVERVLKTS